jgi:hypothetical protein
MRGSFTQEVTTHPWGYATTAFTTDRSGPAWYGVTQAHGVAFSPAGFWAAIAAHQFGHQLRFALLVAGVGLQRE